MSTIFINGVPVEKGSENVYADLGYSGNKPLSFSRHPL